MMSSAPFYPSSPFQAGAKGKGRAEGEPTEHSPLLPSSSAQSSPYAGNHSTSGLSNRGLRARLTFVFAVSLSFCLAILALLAFLAWSYAAKVYHASPDDFVKNAVVLRGPDRVEVMNVSSSGEIWASVDVRLGVNVGSIIGLSRDPSDSLLEGLWKIIGRWGVKRLGHVSATLSSLNITSQHDPSTVLVRIDTQPLVVPLTPDAPPHGLFWLSQISTLVIVQSNTSASVEFLRDSWRRGAVDFKVDVGRVSIQGGDLKEWGWRQMIHQKLYNVQKSVHVQIPPLPGLPHPGHQDPFPSVAELITLKSFRISNENEELALHATATFIDPTPFSFNLTVPPLPFTISLPSTNGSDLPIPVASIFASPFTLTRPNITLELSGKVLPLPIQSIPTLSSFVSRYMSHQSIPILITSNLVPKLSFEAIFPAPNPPPRVLRNVTIHDMKVKPGTTFLVSGTVFARIVLPKGINVDLNVSRIFPDVLVFDGEVPEAVYRLSDPEPAPLPDPLPQRAFGRIRPDSWLNASSTRDDVPGEGEGEGASYTVTAKIVDVPFEVLPGRQKEFSNFVGKVVFGSGGAVAGIIGSAGVSARVHGLPLPGSRGGEIELLGLPFKGNVLVGKKK